MDIYATPHQLIFQLLIRTLSKVNVAVGRGITFAGGLLSVVLQDELVVDVLDKFFYILEVMVLHLLSLSPFKGLTAVSEAGKLSTGLAD